LVEVVDHCERVEALANEILHEVSGVERDQLYDPKGRTRMRESNSPTLQGHGEESLERNLATRLNLGSSVFSKGRLTLEPPGE